MLKFYKMLNIKTILFLLTVFIFELSCSLITFEDLTFFSNISDNQNYFYENSIIVNFSSEMNNDKTEKIIFLKENSNIINTSFKWNEKCCEIIPESALTKGKQYSFVISGQAVTKDNKHFDIKYERTFIYGIKDDLFTLTEYSNPDILNSDQTLSLKFSKQIDISSFENSFTISPNIKLKKTYSENLYEIKLTPEQGWPVNTYFIWSIEKLHSKDEYELCKKYSDTFFTFHDYIQPKLISSNLNNIKITDNLFFSFNKKMDLKSFENNFSISPYINGYFSQNENDIIFHPENNFEIGKNYSIIISSKTCDENSIPIYQEIKKTFKPVNHFLKITSVSINENLNLPFNQNQITKINFSQTQTAFIEIIFSNSINKKNITSAEKAITLQPIFPTETSFPKLTNVKWNQERNKVILTYSNMINTDILYKLTVNSSKNYFQTEENEYMEENLCIYFLTE